VVGVAAIAVLRVLGVYMAALMAVVLALFAFIAIAVPNSPDPRRTDAGVRQGGIAAQGAEPAKRTQTEAAIAARG
jgi:hypothetical protein